ncbi:similar to Saccharomyces cerevisiae YDR292C SRP101 Signal recognition particle (SRP) receptor alpha subunit [Maudiozyma barnettii]|uniref:Signal recognition particle receptor subunit alpha homolog n=1 Tax=Maudiozyma barnettii TaxID=61262 RepID=A0A8H2VGV8_9SACH|nr:Signal recognition particle receptor subunit alpha [Kazachstania barnettii]CAB4254954.1 similar to Saccharomyces cerevisiae YDR292C SRP101 Signal recognition particle (SRP) receptor alpha subunit [Kazachstania barnettii]CAD1783225.1 similar to Saccharomyces cerevisiae YDR292C SRP101 Signal recognition particle (SRP) receptor alpha subunit [Kazachstania barnettii]
MFDQLAIFTGAGQVLYQYNCNGRKFAESQIGAFINQLIISPVTKKDNVNGKYSVVNVTATEKHATRSFYSMFYLSRQPELYFVITFPEQSLELNKEAEATLDLALALWDSLEIDVQVTDNIKANNDVLVDLGEDLSKFDEYLKAKYEESIKFIAKSVTKDNDEPVTKDITPEQNNKKSNKNSIKNNNNKGGRKWGRDAMIEDTSNIDSSALDFSESVKDSETNNSSNNNLEIPIDKDDFGNRTDKGDFLIKEIDDLLSSNVENKKEQHVADGTSSYLDSAFGFLQKNFLGNKTISNKDLKPALESLKKKLISKNVAPEAADYLTDLVKKDLVGSKTESWTTVEDAARSSLTKALTQVLTPGVSVDLLHEIQNKTGVRTTDGKKNPYVFSVVGVNGVGKSTNLSKLAFWLLQNNFKVLIVACDTFRSGAVEQLRVHVENLAQLMDESHIRGSKNKRGKTGNDYVELFEAGYGGSDLVTKIAKQAIKYAGDQDFDIVLMDTAGRRHNDATLMSPLKSFAEQAKPDKIIMVGEALVGTDSVQQAKNFNDAFGRARDLDFFIISKCDTVGDMLGAMVNMVYATGIPILFVGVGQTYTDLRTLSVSWAVNTLMA